jgi:hypothetical protein
MRKRTTRNTHVLTVVKTIGGYSVVDCRDHSVVAKRFTGPGDAELRDSAVDWLRAAGRAGRRVSCVMK